MHQGEMNSLMNEPNQVNGMLDNMMIGDVNLTSHPNNNRKAPGKLKYEF